MTRPTHDRTFECLGAARRAQLVLQEEAEHADSKRSAPASGEVDACDYAALRTWGARAAVKRALLA